MLFYKLKYFCQEFSDNLNLVALRSVLASCGKNVYIHGSVSISNPTHVYLGNGVQLLKGVTMKSRSQLSVPTITLGENVKVHEYTYIDDYGGSITIGDNSGIGHFCVIAGHGGLQIGKDCMIAGCTYIIPANHQFRNLNKAFREQSESKKGITIGDNVWIGAGCIILDGVTIGSNSVVGAGSVVTKDIPSGAIAFGNPARVNHMIQDNQTCQLSL